MTHASVAGSPLEVPAAPGAALGRHRDRRRPRRRPGRRPSTPPRLSAAPDALAARRRLARRPRRRRRRRRRRARGDRAGPRPAPSPLASVTKLLVAYAVLVAVEEGSVDPRRARRSARRHRAPPAGPRRRSTGSRAGPVPWPGRHPPDLLQRRLRGAGRPPGRRARPWPWPTTSPRRCSPRSAWRPPPSHGSPAARGRGDRRRPGPLRRRAAGPALVHGDTLAAATTVQFPGLDGVLPGFGVQRPTTGASASSCADAKAPHWTGTANDPADLRPLRRRGTFLWVDPVAGLPASPSPTGAFGPWAVEAWPAFSDAVLAATR